MNPQARYIAHQLKKKETLIGLIQSRHSTRIFSEKPVEQAIIDKIIASVDRCPSSCDRKAISVQVVESRDDKALLGGLLVGGVGWVHRADKVLLIFADGDAYKERLVYMPFLDAGVVIYHLYLMAHYYDLKCCYINPNIRTNNLPQFQTMFGDGIYCGAIGLGYENK